MADAAKKAQKLAAARKKLKEFQQKSVKSIKNDENPASSVTTTNSSRHSSISNGNSIDYSTERVSFETEYQQPSPLHNYFNGNEQNHFYTENQRLEETVNFFDNLPVHGNAATNAFENALEKYQCDSNTNDIPSLDYPEVESRSVYGVYSKEEHPTVSSEDAKRLSEFLGANHVAINTRENQQFYTEVSINQDNSNYSNQLSKELFSEQSLASDVPRMTDVVEENVTEISRIPPQLNMKSEYLSSATNIDNMENNSKLLNHHDLESQLKEYQLKLMHLEDKLEQNKIEYEHRLSTELSSLQERLHGHVKTIEMYIAENNGLSDSLLQSQTLVKQKVGESEELQGRLKASRSRVADLEKELQAVKIEKTKLDQAHIYEAEINQLKQSHEELKQLKEETSQDVLELREKLNIKANENIGLQRELQDVSNQLSLAQIKIEQITVGDNLQSQSHVEVLTQQKTELEMQLLDLSQTLKTMVDEKSQTNLQYQHYVQQLNTQVATLANKLETISIENENLSKREQSLVKHIGELEKHLQSIQDEKINFGINKSGSAETKKELEATLELAESLRKEKEEVQEKYEHICGDQDDLLAELATKKDIIEQLENELERFKVDQPNNVKLLATIESDKVAASRAVAQNTTLKQELEEMQQAFVRMSNDKLDLTEQLSSEQFKSYELQERLSLLETNLHTLSDAIEIKDNELTHIRETLSHQNKQLLQNNQLTDRLRHYEAQDGSSNALQEDLQRAQDRINELLTENLKLKSELTRTITNEVENLKLTDDIALTIPETSETKITVAFSETQTHNDELGYSKRDNSLDKEIAMKHLEDKFTRTMADIANLTEEKQKLEHIVMQLQGETDTIGEYIALYQHQRGILQQRTQEKEEQLRRLSNDRINVKNKLEVINGLVNKLVHEKGLLTPEILEQHDATHDTIPGHDNYSHNSHSVPSNTSEGENNNLSSETADQILQLISEIKSSNLVQPCDALGDFHPCSCCSGQLFTV